MVDLKRRTVLDVPPDRTSASVAEWFRAFPEVEIVSRNRHGLYAEGIRHGAPQARQVADRFHLVQNLRERIEAQLGCLGRPIRKIAAPAFDEAAAVAIGARQTMFDQVQALFGAGKTVMAITRDLGLGRRRVEKWVRLQALPGRIFMVLKTGSPANYRDYMARRRAKSCTVVRRLFTEIQELGYTGCYAHLARFAASWDREDDGAPLEPASATAVSMPRDTATGRLISPQAAATLCMTFRLQLPKHQASVVDALKAVSPDFAIMRRFEMRFRGILRGHDTTKLKQWLQEAYRSGVYALQGFVRILKQDLDAVQNAVIEPWSGGQAEGQINRLKC
jgi:hypothetical protein